jgi:NAD(P) transhydrogenase subunit alpha
MFVNVAVLKEAQAHERRVALVPAVVAKLVKLGARLHMQSGAGGAVALPDEAHRDADIVLAIQPPALAAIGEMKAGAILVSFIYEDHEPALVTKHIAAADLRALRSAAA